MTIWWNNWRWKVQLYKNFTRIDKELLHEIVDHVTFHIQEFLEDAPCTKTVLLLHYVFFPQVNPTRVCNNQSVWLTTLLAPLYPKPVGPLFLSLKVRSFTYHKQLRNGRRLFEALRNAGTFYMLSAPYMANTSGFATLPSMELNTFNYISSTPWFCLSMWIPTISLLMLMWVPFSQSLMVMCLPRHNEVNC